MYSDQRTCAVRLSTIMQFFSGSQNSVLKHGVFKNVVPHKLYSYFCQILPTFCKQRQTIRCGQALCVMPKAYASCDEKGDWWHLMYLQGKGVSSEEVKVLFLVRSGLGFSFQADWLSVWLDIPRYISCALLFILNIYMPECFHPIARIWQHYCKR